MRFFKKDGFKPITILSIAALCILPVSLTGCSALNELTAVIAPDSDTVHTKLASLMSSPNSLDYNKDYVGTPLTFYGMVTSEPEVLTFDEGDSWNGAKVITVTTAKAPESYMYLNISSLPETPELYEVYEFTAKIDGTIYDIVDNQRIDVLSAVASKMTHHPIPEEDIPSDTVFNLPQGTVEYVGFDYYYEDDFRKSLIAYYNFTNTTDKSIRPLSLPITVFQDDILNMQSYTSFPLRNDAVDFFTETPAGKTMLYFAVYSVSDSDSPVYFDLYRNDFSIENSINVIPSEYAASESETQE